MKKFIQIVLIMGLLLFAAGSASAAEGIGVSFDGVQIEFDADFGIPFIDENNRAQVPFRQTLEAFGATVEWDEVSRTAIAKKNGVIVKAPIGADHIFRNEVKIVNDTSALIRDGRTFLPFRVVFEAFGADVSYDQAAKTVVVKHVAFDDFLAKQFIEYVTSDSITLRYVLKHPENYGIESFEPNFGGFGFNDFMAYLEECKQVLTELERFSYDALDESRKLIFDIFKYSLETELLFEEFYYYQANLSPAMGIQSDIPILLAEYRFYSEDDVIGYLKLLPEVGPYFQRIIQTEREKSALGLFMADFTVDAVVEQCIEFVNLKEKHYLIETFDARVDELNLSQEKKASFKKENREKVLNDVIPAYKDLADSLKKLKGTGKNKGGLSNLKNGKEYYEHLVKYLTGSDKSVKQMAGLTDMEIIKMRLKLMELFADGDTEALIEHLINPDFALGTPDEIIEIQRKRMADFYPAGPAISYTVKNVHPSLEKHLSPAFYILPPIDDYTSNVIYINNKWANDDMLFATLAHEGFPGHLYQTTYFAHRQPRPIRSAFSFIGYIEGWATYAEFNSFGFLDFPEMQEELENLFRMSVELDLAIQSRVDIGVNYEGWSERDLKKYLETFGWENATQFLYRHVIQNPGNFLQYYIGYLEFLELRDHLANSLGDDFSLKDFHQRVLDVGPTPFPILRKVL